MGLGMDAFDYVGQTFVAHCSIQLDSKEVVVNARLHEGHDRRIR
jgi:hypothetical protein